MGGENPTVHASTEVMQLELKSGQWVQVIMKSGYNSKTQEYDRVATVELHVTENDEIEILTDDKEMKLQDFKKERK